ncbi:MAG: LysM peptidoglycan-binding domain-containing protein [Ilumatobacter sp.]|jgi:LysM repeat protein|uniref:LysM peptidoglycan-binding domain-containing protein n=1 Tax=Ilumatobacter sp. TaxID=1967498 RepID=UPI003918CD4D
MGVKNSRRLVVVAWPFVMAGVLLGACGGSEASEASRSTFNLGSTAFVTRPPETTTTTIPGAVIEDGRVIGEQDYTVQAGDFPLGVANRFDITVEDLGAYNGWPTCGSLSCPEFPGPGTPIKIPPGAADLGATAITAPPGVEVVTGGEAEQPVGETIPPAGDNCQPGSYTIEEGDFEGRVAEKFDVTVEALRAANAGTADYNVFYVGLQIVIPAKSDC